LILQAISTQSSLAWLSTNDKVFFLTCCSNEVQTFISRIQLCRVLCCTTFAESNFVERS